MHKFSKRRFCYSLSPKDVSLQHENTLRLEYILVTTKLTIILRILSLLKQLYN